MLKVQLPDGSVREYSKHVRPIDIAAEIGAGLAKATLAAEIGTVNMARAASALTAAPISGGGSAGGCTGGRGPP